MNKRQKTNIIILASVVGLALVVIAAVCIIKDIKYNVGNTEVYIESKTALAGDTVKAPIVVAKNCGDGLWGAQIEIDYDSDALEFVSCANGEMLEICQPNSETGRVIIVLENADKDNVKKNGTLATLNFKIKEGTVKGDYNLKFSENSAFATVDGEMIYPDFKDGVITVK